jgi:hypothetical protein
MRIVLAFVIYTAIVIHSVDHEDFCRWQEPSRDRRIRLSNPRFESYFYGGPMLLL